MPLFGPLELERDTPCRLALGTLELWIERGARQWSIGSRRIERQALPSSDRTGLAWPADLSPTTHAAPSGTGGLEIRPASPSRRVVFSPARPWVVHPGDGVDVWAELPLSLVLLHGEAELLRAALLPEKETWFGPSTVDGELAFFVRGAAPIADKLPAFPPDVARTKLRLENGGKAAISIERVLLPAVSLSLWIDPEGKVFTPAVTVRTDQDAHLAKVTVADGPPREATEPRPTPGQRPRAITSFEVDIDRVLGRV